MKLGVEALCLLVLSLACAQGLSHDDWYKTVYKANGTENIVFNCLDVSEEDPLNSGNPRAYLNKSQDVIKEWEDAVPEYWLFDTNRIDKGESYKNNLMVSNNGSTLTILNANTSYFGIYHCVMRKPDDSVYLVRWGLNIKGPYFEDLWQKYETNFLIGLGAMFGFLLLAGLVMLIYYKRYIPGDSSSLDEVSMDKKIQQYYNSGYIYENDIEMKGTQVPPAQQDSDVTKEKLSGGGGSSVTTVSEEAEVHSAASSEPPVYSAVSEDFTKL